MDVDKWLGSVTLYEAAQIWERLNSTCEPHKLVLWSGIKFKQAEDWARQNNRKTLTQAMGPLMDKSSPTCRYNIKTDNQWCLYVHAASILFALYISKGKEVVVLARHPPERFNPYHESYYQNIEEPWLTACCDRDVFKIMLAHPQIEGAGDYIYQYWPVDRVNDWITSFPHAEALKHRPWPPHSWDSAKMSEYGDGDLRRERCNIMEKLYIYKTGASIYWVVTVGSPAVVRCILALTAFQSPANSLTVHNSTKRRHRISNTQQPQIKANTSRPDASTPPRQAKVGSARTKTKSTSKAPTSPPTSSKKKRKRKKRNAMQTKKKIEEQASKADQGHTSIVVGSRAKVKANGGTKTKAKAKVR